MINKLKIFVFLLSVIAVSCLDDDLVSIDKIELDETAEILRYIESTGDYANTELAPSLVYAQNIFTNKEQYFILDIREPAEYSVGHIDGAVNISTSNLYETVDSLYKINPVKNIVVVSQNGQASSYFTCLLRLAGYNNVYTLNYGMASWNIDFANEWLGALGNNDNSYSNQDFPKNAFTHLPHLDIPPILRDAKEKTIYRIKEIINKGFLKNINFSETISSNEADELFLICYGEGRLYYAPRDLGSLGHPDNAVWFMDAILFEFRSIHSLQTLPNDQSILIYSGDGQLSATMVAYLTVLGYNVKTLLFGANQLFYSRLSSDLTLIKYVFSNIDIMNYPYITGN